jgi:tetratricopeptide (TPR) repeat protein
MRGFSRFQENDLDAALEDLKKAAELEPRTAVTFIYMGDAHVKKKDDAAAKADFTQAIDLDPANPDPWYRRGNALMRAKAWGFAVSDFTRAIELRRVPVYFRERGHAYRGKGDKEKALEDLEEYLRLAPRAADARRIHADIAALRK